MLPYKPANVEVTPEARGLLNRRLVNSLRTESYRYSITKDASQVGSMVYSLESPDTMMIVYVLSAV